MRGCVLAAVALRARSASDVESLVQSTVNAHSFNIDSPQVASFLGPVVQKVQADMANLKKLGDMIASPFNCTAHPALCREPFNCEGFTLKRAMPVWLTYGMAYQKKANLKTWCSAPQYSEYMETCLAKKDLVGAGKLQYEASKAGVFGGAVFEADGSYCFLEGHCVNGNVTAQTTLEEADKECDTRYGNARWTMEASLFSPTREVDTPGYGGPPANHTSGFTSRKQTTPFLVAACAMGNYHCDVVYCKETYCKDPYFVKKYGHHLKEQGHDDGSYVTNFLANTPAVESAEKL